MRTWFITGGTPGGFGLVFADAVLARGDQVAITSRRPAELADWAAPHGENVLVVEVDVTDAGQVRAGVAAAEKQFGGIDVLVNNAGRGWYGSIEGMRPEDVRRVMELNFFAVLEVTRAVLPGMRARGSGWVVNMSSVAGLRGIEGFGYYSAAKFAVEAVTDVLRAEVAEFGIKVLAVEPGAFRTRAYSNFADEPLRETVDAYLPQLDVIRKTMIDQDGNQPGDPERGVQAVLQAMDRESPPRRLVLGSGGFDAAVNTLASNLADIRASEALSRSADFPA
ncbi:short-chain dehydrogenase/reductase SDR [Kribbella flavida DSM 17836]|uniref:Short-chain dehydrogenase/reductase SDR n=1 Tax=Kribbella flavida (strain DSM 17836 / JCM 10339 / NBRC 14399) TaxID=479435 RepID=D2PR02_KRIFD|nr:SDR family NAD(P)-dependent oxidoreductase [Kribbella flavida]ADB31135.1 short-chain dehydrogenase/reductase SDR [Kribbella flavida DSM 17836]